MLCHQITGSISIVPHFLFSVSINFPSPFDIEEKEIWQIEYMFSPPLLPKPIKMATQLFFKCMSPQG